MFQSLKSQIKSNKITNIEYEGLILNMFWMPYIVVDNKLNSFNCENILTILGLWPTNFTDDNRINSETIPFLVVLLFIGLHIKGPFIKHGICFAADRYINVNPYFYFRDTLFIYKILRLETLILNAFAKGGVKMKNKTLISKDNSNLDGNFHSLICER